ncbi:DegV family protein [Beduini massiliensis]|uniref:DegV family protein n=1 Tax=Beduini massiliensis TaxID=1585974 RepID=UPI00059A820E|nr:DegV family protein [Beduini massiliensis]
MKKIAIVTDSNSSISQKEGKELGISIIPMPFTINGKEYFEDINLSSDEFFELLESGNKVFTSQPSAGNITALWDELLEEYDEILHMPMSSGLSGSCQTAMLLAEEYKGKVFVVNNQRISITLKHDVLEALKLIDQGKDAQYIKDILEVNKFNSTIYITVPTLEYLKRGGRLTPLAAALGGLLKLKPILTIQGEKLDAFEKTRTMAKAHKIMAEALVKDINEKLDPKGKGANCNIYVAYTKDEQIARDMVEYLKEYFPNNVITYAPLSLSIACHTGPNAIGIGACLNID